MLVRRVTLRKIKEKVWLILIILSVVIILSVGDDLLLLAGFRNTEERGEEVIRKGR